MLLDSNLQRSQSAQSHSSRNCAQSRSYSPFLPSRSQQLILEGKYIDKFDKGQQLGQSRHGSVNSLKSSSKVVKARSTSLHERLLRSSAAQFAFQRTCNSATKLLQSVAHVKCGGGNRPGLTVSPHPGRMTKVRIYIGQYVVTSFAVSPPGHDRFSWLWEAVGGEVLHFLSASTCRQSSQHVI